MKLDEYLSQNDISPQEFGRRLGVKSPSTVYRYMCGKRLPDKYMMKKIADLTDNLVLPNDFYGWAPQSTIHKNKHNTALS